MRFFQATSVDIERVFSLGRLIMSCVDVEVVVRIIDVEGKKEEELEQGWDSILL
jgi:hypothetical protein